MGAGKGWTGVTWSVSAQPPSPAAVGHGHSDQVMLCAKPLGLAGPSPLLLWLALEPLLSEDSCHLCSSCGHSRPGQTSVTHISKGGETEARVAR